MVEGWVSRYDDEDAWDEVGTTVMVNGERLTRWSRVPVAGLNDGQKSRRAHALRMRDELAGEDVVRFIIRQPGLRRTARRLDTVSVLSSALDAVRLSVLVRGGVEAEMFPAQATVSDCRLDRFASVLTGAEYAAVLKPLRVNLHEGGRIVVSSGDEGLFTVPEGWQVVSGVGRSGWDSDGPFRTWVALVPAGPDARDAWAVMKRQCVVASSREGWCGLDEFAHLVVSALSRFWVLGLERSHDDEPV